MFAYVRIRTGSSCRQRRNVVRVAPVPECYGGISLQTSELCPFHWRSFERFPELRSVYCKKLTRDRSRIIRCKHRARFEFCEAGILREALIPRADILACLLYT